jgi:hypothetical protein
MASTPVEGGRVLLVPPVRIPRTEFPFSSHVGHVATTVRGTTARGFFSGMLRAR